MQKKLSSILAIAITFTLTTSALAMTPTEREKARFHLLNSYNEADLLIRNHKSFERDVKRQEQDFKGMKVFERIPLTDNLQDLREQLEDSAKHAKIEVTSFGVGKRKSINLNTIPKAIYSSDEFRIPQDKLVETIPLKLSFKGTEKEVRRWIASWDDEILRLVEPRGKIHASGGSIYQLDAVTYRFTDVQYPTLQEKDPILFLPVWAQKNPEKFAQEEPKLWDYVVKAREIFPESTQYLKFRQQYLMNDARISFYLAKTANTRTIEE